MALKKQVFLNWKMNPVSGDEAINLMSDYKMHLGDKTDDIVFFPPSIYLDYAKAVSMKNYGVQNIAHKDSGSFTGQISVKMAKDAGCTHVLIGHSECFGFLGETLEGVRQKTLLTLQNDLTPVICIGQTFEYNEEGEVDADSLSDTLQSILDDEEIKKSSDLILAYEPVWAIGTGKVASLEHIERVAQVIRKKCSQIGIEKITVLYGGSVDDKNVKVLKESQSVDGFLIGKISLQPEALQRLVNELI
jgi:triosephosphate isomerase (TIM)